MLKHRYHIWIMLNIWLLQRFLTITLNDGLRFIACVFTDSLSLTYKYNTKALWFSSYKSTLVVSKKLFKQWYIHWHIAGLAPYTFDCQAILPKLAALTHIYLMCMARSRLIVYSNLLVSCGTRKNLSSLCIW